MYERRSQKLASLLGGALLFPAALACADAPDAPTVGLAHAHGALDHDHGPTPQHVDPIFNQTDHRAAFPNEVFVTPSATTKLTVGHRLDLPSDFGQLITPYLVQRLTDRTYWISVNVFQSLAYVGNRGVLLIDCAGHGGPADAENLIAAVASITPLPITHLVYSHPHTDHIGNASYLKRRFPALEIIASKQAAEEIELNDYPMEMPTRTVDERFGHFTFEGRRFRMVTPVPVSHTTADSYIITPDRVLHAVDFVHPMRLPFINNMVNQNMDGYILFLRYLAGEEGNYDFASWGHLNVGYARDVTLTLDYYKALYRNWSETADENPISDFVDPTQDNAAVWFRNYFDGFTEQLFYKVSPRFGHIGMIELGRDHAERVHESMFVYRFNPATGEPAKLPSFAPIRPRY